MKVSEAEKKVCPFMSLNGLDRNGIAYVVKSKCICGDCMAWRWDERSVMSLEGGGFDYSEAEGYCARIGNA